MLRALIIFLITFYLIGLIIKWVIKRKINNLNQDKYQKTKKEGEITVKYNKNTNKKISKNEGEYVDYEEVDL